MAGPRCSSSGSTCRRPLPSRSCCLADRSDSALAQHRCRELPVAGWFASTVPVTSRARHMHDLDLVFQSQADRTRDALTRFLSHKPSNIALAGSVAMAAQLSVSGWVAPSRAFGDIDLVASSLEDLPSTLAAEFLCPHVHGTARQGRTLAQFVHPYDAVRIDAFRVIGEALSRATEFRFGTESILVLSAEDQAARAASLCMKLERGGTVAAKHAAVARPARRPDRHRLARASPRLRSGGVR